MSNKKENIQVVANVFYTESGNVYLVPNHYDKSLDYIEGALNYAKKIGLTIPKNQRLE